jgi:hypothetical protein
MANQTLGLIRTTGVYFVAGFLLSLHTLAQQDEIFKTVAAPTVKLRYKEGKAIIEKGHWSFNLRDGERIFEDGVIYERGTVDDTTVLFAGVPEQPSMVLLKKFMQLDSLSPDEKKPIRRDILNWYVRTQFKDLSETDANELLKVYEVTALARQSLEDELKLSQTEKPTKRQWKRYQKALAEIMTKFTLDERRIFDRNDKARFVRYRKSLTPLTTVSRKDRKKIVKESYEFFSGSYQTKPVRPEDTLDFSPDLRYYEEPGSRLNASIIKPVVMLLPLLDPSGKCRRKGSEIVTTSSDEVIIGHEGRAFVAEHNASYFGIETNFYHTSIVAGIWDVVQWRETTRTRTCDNIDSSPTISQISTKISTQSQFNSWRVASGASSTYKRSDELTKFYVFGGVGVSADAVLKKLRGVTADKNGHRCRTRYAAFPEGGYGTDWVCHQAANAFTLKKWNKLPIHYSVSYIHWGDYGDMTDITAPCQCHFEQANHACIPGASGTGCCKNWCYQACRAWGYGLSEGWHPTKGWIDTEAKFNSHKVKIPGPDSHVRSVTEDGFSDVIVADWWARARF